MLKLADAAVMASLMLIPLIFQPLRYEAYETYRAGLLALLVFIMLPGLIVTWRWKVSHKPLLIALLLWSVAVSLATIFSLSPMRSLVGDLERGQGTITQLVLVCAVLIGSRVNPLKIWRWVWLVAVINAVYGILQSAALLPNPYFERAAGTFGSPTHAGSWFTLALLWLIAGFLCDFQRLSRWKRIALAIGILV
ncbi:MAG TPA: hypothetical protein VHL11_15755, partial [Phototrophicaceae bacterium]|nr:hypothetical protein [Phototrophicaceae bacterium]